MDTKSNDSDSHVVLNLITREISVLPVTEIDVKQHISIITMTALKAEIQVSISKDPLLEVIINTAKLLISKLESVENQNPFTTANQASAEETLFIPAKLTTITPGQAKYLLCKLVDLPLECRTSNCLKAAGVDYVWNLADYADYNLEGMLRWPNFGKRSLGDLKETLSKLIGPNYESVLQKINDCNKDLLQRQWNKIKIITGNIHFIELKQAVREEYFLQHQSFADLIEHRVVNNIYLRDDNPKSSEKANSALDSLKGVIRTYICAQEKFIITGALNAIITQNK